MKLDYQVNSIVQMKKDHACGANEFKVTRIGADIGIVCTKCQRKLLMPRFEFNQKIATVLKK